MSAEELSDVGRGLEDSFYAETDEDLQDSVRKAADMNALSAVTGITNEDILGMLVDAGIDRRTLPALSLVPLVAVAWADGSIDQKEIDAVLSGAEQTGLKSKDVSYKLLKRWLLVEPRGGLLNAWKEYMGALRTKMADADREKLRDDLVGRARAVAEAAGSFLGIGSNVSNTEQEVLDEMMKAFD